MWYLQRKGDGKIVYLLNKEYSIGRKNCAIELPDDLTVSRQHLKLLVDYSALTLSSGIPLLKVMDLASSYGVCVNPSAFNNGKIEPKTWVSLEKDFTLHFGIKNEWVVRWKDIFVVCSAIGATERRKLNKELAILGAKLFSDWQENISHLVTDKIVLTQKVLDSLLAAKPIVGIEYFEEWVKVLEKSPWSPVPDISNFTPTIGQALGHLQSKSFFLPKEERKSLFNGKTFAFPTQSELNSSMALAIRKAGGKTTSVLRDQTDLLLVECSNSQTEDYTRLLSVIKARGERPIPIKEIGLAIISCSTVQYCNPRLPSLENSVTFNQNKDTNDGMHFAIAENTQLNSLSQISSNGEQCEEQPPLKKIKTEQFSPSHKKLRLDEQVAVAGVHPVEVSDTLKRKQAIFRPKTFSNNDVEASQTQPVKLKVDVPQPNVTNVSISKKPKFSRSLTVDIVKTRGVESFFATQSSEHKHQWKTQNKDDLNTSKLAVKKRLVRCHLVDRSRITQNEQKRLVKRIQSMKIACFKEGKWSVN